MRKHVYEYIKNNPSVSANMVANKLGIDGLEVLKVINKLQEDGLIKIGATVPLNKVNNCSVYYEVTGKEYSE